MREGGTTKKEIDDNGLTFHPFLRNTSVWKWQRSRWELTCSGRRWSNSFRPCQSRSWQYAWSLRQHHSYIVRYVLSYLFFFPSSFRFYFLFFSFFYLSAYKMHAIFLHISQKLLRLWHFRINVSFLFQRAFSSTVKVAVFAATGRPGEWETDREGALLVSVSTHTHRTRKTKNLKRVTSDQNAFWRTTSNKQTHKHIKWIEIIKSK